MLLELNVVGCATLEGGGGGGGVDVEDVVHGVVGATGGEVGAQGVVLFVEEEIGYGGGIKLEVVVQGVEVETRYTGIVLLLVVQGVEVVSGNGGGIDEEEIVTGGGGGGEGVYAGIEDVSQGVVEVVSCCGGGV